MADTTPNLPVKPLSFKERMTERIRESIGDLISDEELSKIVDEGLRSAFFERKRVDNGYGREQFTTPLINQIVIDLMKPVVEDEVKSWFSKNEGEIDAIVSAVIKDGMVGMVTGAINSTFKVPLYNLQNEINNVIKNISHQ